MKRKKRRRVKLRKRLNVRLRVNRNTEERSTGAKATVPRLPCGSFFPPVWACAAFRSARCTIEPLRASTNGHRLVEVVIHVDRCHVRYSPLRKDQDDSLEQLIHHSRRSQPSCHVSVTVSQAYRHRHRQGRVSSTKMFAHEGAGGCVCQTQPTARRVSAARSLQETIR